MCLSIEADSPALPRDSPLRIPSSTPSDSVRLSLAMRLVTILFLIVDEGPLGEGLRVVHLGYLVGSVHGEEGANNRGRTAGRGGCGEGSGVGGCGLLAHSACG